MIRKDSPLFMTRHKVGTRSERIKSDVKPTKATDAAGGSGSFPEWHGEHITIDSDDEADKKVTSSPPPMATGEDCFSSDSVNQGSPTSLFDDISISNMSPLSESKLIKNLSEFLSFE